MLTDFGKKNTYLPQRFLLILITGTCGEPIRLYTTLPIHIMAVCTQIYNIRYIV